MSSFTVLTLLVCSCVILVDAGRSLYTSTTSASASTPQMVKASSTKVGSKTVYNVTWAEVKPNSYETIAAKCGDEVIFNWSGHTHDVGIATDGKCDKIEPLTPRSSRCGSMLCLYLYSTSDGNTQWLVPCGSGQQGQAH